MSGGILDKEGKNIIILIHFLCKKISFLSLTYKESYVAIAGRPICGFLL